ARVHQLGETTAERLLQLNQLPALDHAFEVPVGGQQQRRRGRLVEFTTLDAKEPILDHVAAAYAVPPSENIQFPYQIHRRRLLAVQAARQAALEADGEDGGLGGGPSPGGGEGGGAPGGGPAGMGEVVGGEGG